MQLFIRRELSGADLLPAVAVPVILEVNSQLGVGGQSSEGGEISLACGGGGLALRQSLEHDGLGQGAVEWRKKAMQR